MMASPGALIRFSIFMAMLQGAGAGLLSNLRPMLVADHLGAFLPGNPEVIVENVPGAGSLKVATCV